MFTTKPSVQKLQEKSASIVSVFTKTINELTEVNNQIETEKSAREEAIAKAELEKSQLEDQHKQNTKLISKIQNLLN